MNKKIINAILLSIMMMGSGLFVVNTALAADAGSVTSLVHCGRITENQEENHPCGYNDLITGLQSAITFVITYFIIPIMVLVMLRAGVMLIISDNKASAKKDAQNALWNAFKGLFFILTAWLIVDSLISFFGVKVRIDPKEGPIKVLGK